MMPLQNSTEISAEVNSSLLKLAPIKCSLDFKQFVASCLNKEPQNRPAPKDLLKMKFLKNAKKNSILQEPINKFKKWKKRNPTEEDVENELDATIKVLFLLFFSLPSSSFFLIKGAYNNFEKLEVISFYMNVFLVSISWKASQLEFYRLCLFWTLQNMTSFLSIDPL